MYITAQKIELIKKIISAHLLKEECAEIKVKAEEILKRREKTK